MAVVLPALKTVTSPSLSNISLTLDNIIDDCTTLQASSSSDWEEAQYFGLKKLQESCGILQEASKVQILSGFNSHRERTHKRNIEEYIYRKYGKKYISNHSQVVRILTGRFNKDYEENKLSFGDVNNSEKFEVIKNNKRKFGKVWNGMKRPSINMSLIEEIPRPTYLNREEVEISNKRNESLESPRVKFMKRISKDFIEKQLGIKNNDQLSPLLSPRKEKIKKETLKPVKVTHKELLHVIDGDIKEKHFNEFNSEIINYKGDCNNQLKFEKMKRNMERRKTMAENIILI